MSLTITFTDEEASAVEAQLKQIERDRYKDESSIAVKKHLDRLEAARIRFTQAIQETHK